MDAPSSGWIGLIKDAGKAWSADNASRLAAALAYYTMVSLAPILVLSVTVLGIFLRDAPGAVEHQMSQLMGQTGADAAKQMIDHAKTQGRGILSTIISIIILVFGAAGVFGELQSSMNTIWGVKARPDLSFLRSLKSRFLSIAMVFGVCFLLLVSLVLSAALSFVVGRLMGGSHVIGYLIDLVASLLVVTLLFAMIFKFLPDVDLDWRDTWIGAVLTSVLFTLGKIGLGIYLAKGATASAYGAAGSLAALLIWIYYSSQIMFFGAECTKAYCRQMGRHIPPSDDAVPLTEPAGGAGKPSDKKPGEKSASSNGSHAPLSPDAQLAADIEKNRLASEKAHPE